MQGHQASSIYIYYQDQELYAFILLDVFWFMGNYFFLSLSIDFIHWGLYKTLMVFTPLRYSQQEMYFLAEVFHSTSVGRNLIFMYKRNQSKIHLYKITNI